MPQPSLSEFQQQAIDALRQQQDAYLTLVREWKRAAGAKAFPQQPTPFTPTLDPSASRACPRRPSWWRPPRRSPRRSWSSSSAS